MRVNKKVRSGNEIKVIFDGKEIGLVRSVSGSDDYSPEPASGIGDIHVAEWVPTMARHNINVSAMQLAKGALLAAGIVPENGDEVLKGLVFDLEKYGADGVLVRKWTDCSYASGSIETQAHQIVVTNAVFNAIDVSGKG